MVPLGNRVQSPEAMVKVGGQLQGPLLVQDINLLETLSHITHERIPERYDGRPNKQHFQDPDQSILVLFMQRGQGRMGSWKSPMTSVT